MNATHAYFYLQLTIWASFVVYYIQYEDYAEMTKLVELDAVNKLMPVLLLVISLTIFRFKLNYNRNQKFFARETIILVHLTISILFVVVYAANLMLYSRSYNTPLKSSEKCRQQL